MEFSIQNKNNAIKGEFLKKISTESYILFKLRNQNSFFREFEFLIINKKMEEVPRGNHIIKAPYGRISFFIFGKVKVPG